MNVADSSSFILSRFHLNIFGTVACVVLYLNVQISQCFRPDMASHFDKHEWWIEPIEPVQRHGSNRRSLESLSAQILHRRSEDTDVRLGELTIAAPVDSALPEPNRAVWDACDIELRSLAPNLIVHVDESRNKSASILLRPETLPKEEIWETLTQYLIPIVCATHSVPHSRWSVWAYLEFSIWQQWNTVSRT